MVNKMPKVLDQENNKFSMTSNVQFAVTGGKNDEPSKQRQFSGVAYTGDVIPGHYYWGNVIFDMSTITIPDKLPALIDHSRSQRCGYVTEFGISEDKGILVTGKLLSNEFGKSVAEESDEGFPWQMSVHIEPGSVEEVSAGTSLIVNGRSVAGPLTIFRNSTISEVSFTATGWDRNTTATAMSKGQQQQTIEEPSMTPEEIAAMKAENEALKSQLTGAQATIADFSKNARVQQIKEMFTKHGIACDEASEQFKSFSNMSDEAFKAAATAFSMMPVPATTPAATAPANLFSHQANGGAQGATNASTQVSHEEALLADAKKRGSDFAKRAH